MKLRNKKTGGLANCEPIEVKTDAGFHDYYSLAELYEEWEDYKPAEPLIKDEKVRKAVRAWAEACGVGDSEELRVCQGHGCSFIHIGATDAQFSLLGIDYGIPYDDYCTITELCGEEEE